MFSWSNPSIIDPKGAFSPWLILFNVTLVTMLAIMSSVTSSIAASSIAGPLMIDNTELAWLSIGYLGTVGICLPFSGWMGKRFGHKFTFFVGFLVFVLASFIATFSMNFWSIIICRVLEGAGAGLIFPLSLTIIQRIFPKEKIVLALSWYVGCGFGAGIGLGLIAGGYIGQYFDWTWVYWINVFVGVPSLLITLFFHLEMGKEPVPPFDFLGYLFFGSFLVAILMIITNAKLDWNTLGWSSTFIRLCLLIAISSFGLFILREAFAENPIVPLHLFKKRHFTVGCVTLLSVGAILFGTATTFPSLLENQLGYQKGTVGVILSIFGLVMGLTGAIIGFITQFINVRILTLIGLITLTVSCFLQDEIITIQSEHWQWMLVLALRAFGIALSLGPVTSLSLVGVEEKDAAAASMIVTFCRQMGGAIGGSIIVLVGVYRNEYHRQIYSSNINPYSPGFTTVLQGFSDRFQRLLGFSPEEAEKLAKVVIVKNLQAQSQLSAINDAFFAMGYFTSFVTVIIGAVIIYALITMRKDHVH